MKKIYIILLFLASYTISAQDATKISDIPNREISEFKLYPNPVFNGFVYITTQNNEEKEIIIYDVFGEIVLMDRIKNKRLDISRLISGVYVVTVTENKKSISRKLVVK
ncbi:T9SS type A sorting domain-containing protein [uncultured Maribacter sp.]|uniref:T9SS type A sorting domain-containing protein n=1 Tax=uncultured Maribacter sp. TaxID=431308 RepID=UPI00262746BB|nr:T9SS type A sorting domain-containing protein [uncultured Maribacter sp.]